MKIFKSIARIALILTVLVFVVVAMVIIPKQQCNKVIVTPHTQNESVVLTSEDVLSMIRNAGIETIGVKAKEVDVAKIQHILQANPYVKEVNYVRLAGTTLMIDYTLRPIVLHVFNNQGEQYFVDKEGFIIPYSPKMTDYMMVANGNINQSYRKLNKASKDLASVVQLTNEILSNDFDAAQYRQIYVTENHQLNLVTTIGQQKILFGTIDNATEKLDNLRNVYKNGFSRKGYDTYAQLDVRCKNRVIAQRKQ